MLHDERNPGNHEKFKELAALADSATLSAEEWSELSSHLRICADCREIYRQYQFLSTIGMPHLAAVYSSPEERENWDDSEAYKKLFDRVRQASDRNSLPMGSIPAASHRFTTHPWLKGGLAAGLGLVVVFGAFHLGRSSKPAGNDVPISWIGPPHQPVSTKESNEQLLALQTHKIYLLQERNVQQEQEIGKLRASLRALEDHSRELAAVQGATEEQLRAVSGQRERLTAQLQEVEQSYQNAKSELMSLRAEHDRVLLHTALLEAKVNDLTALNREQERKLGDDEQFLASDRDIRELMGARKLYIADVFDVDSGSRTRKPFGRVFYTQNKSLIFYAFDLDHQAGVKNASIFQVWGQKDAELSEKARPMNLGILYMDSESNRRWVLRLDDAKQLAEIDAVFVTVEPHEGNTKPSGKPFLYALLRKEPNHP